jgi:hypothetical protein
MQVIKGQVEIEITAAETTVAYEVAPWSPRSGSPFAIAVFPVGGPAEVYDIDGNPIEGYAYDAIVADAAARIAAV